MSFSSTELPVRFISCADCFDLRSRILRPGQDAAINHYAEDNLPTTFHVGVLAEMHTNIFAVDKIVSNGTFMAMSHKYFPEAVKPYRLRGMATDSDFQGQGLGTKILNFAQAHLISENCDLLWFNARVSAFQFYEKNGFQVIGELFDIAGAGPHKVMYKWLSKR